MNVFSEEYRQEQMRRTAAHREMLERLKRLQEQQPSDTFDFRTMRPAEPPKPSRFDGLEVVDLESDADGVWCVPAEMLPFVRAL